MPNVFDRYQLVEDTDETMLSLSKLVQLKEDRKDRMRNDNFKFDFGITSLGSLAPEISVAYFKSQHVRLRLTESPFLVFGKSFSIRIKGSKNIEQFPAILSQSPLALCIKKNILALFFQSFPGYKGDTFSDVGLATDMTTLLTKSAKPLKVVERRDELIPDGQSRVAEPVSDILDDTLPIIFVRNSSDFARRFTTIPAKSSIFDIRGPFGIGLGITRFSSGEYILVGQGSANLCYVDFIDYLTRFYIYSYAKAKSVEQGIANTQQLLTDLDPFHDDLEFTFPNALKIHLYLAFKNKRDFEALFMRDFILLTELEAELKLGIIGNIVVRLPKIDSTYKDRLVHVRFEQTKVSIKDFQQTLASLGLDKNTPSKKVERVVICGRKEFCREWRKGFEGIGLESYKIKGL